eukprot:m.182815 g.182815  ORF g.182815 m.182815 type:complete len:640 (+) comp16889_c0_seq42:1033-2952(+)
MAKEWFDLTISVEHKASQGLGHALGELKANAQDAGKKPVDFVINAAAHCVTITNSGPKLERRHFVTGHSDSRGDASKAGTHGLGLKDALAICYRHGYQMWIESHDVRYDFQLKKSMLANVDTIHVRQSQRSKRSKTRVGALNTRVTIQALIQVLSKSAAKEALCVLKAEVAKVNDKPKPPPTKTSNVKQQQAPGPRSSQTTERSRAERQAAAKIASLKVFKPSANGPGKLKFLRLTRSHQGLPLHYDWDITAKLDKTNSKRKGWFNDDQCLVQKYEKQFEEVLLQHLKAAKINLSSLRPGTLEHSLFISRAALYREVKSLSNSASRNDMKHQPVMYQASTKTKMVTQADQGGKRTAKAASAASDCATPPFKMAKVGQIDRTIEKLNGNLDQQRAWKALNTVRRALDGLKFAEFYPSGSYAKGTGLPSSDLDLIVVFNDSDPSLVKATSSYVSKIQTCMKQAFSDLVDAKTTRFSFQCTISGVGVDILPVAKSIWRSTSSERRQAPSDVSAYYSPAMAPLQVEDFKRRSQAARAGVPSVVRLLKTWLNGHKPWPDRTKPRSCLIEELTLQACKQHPPKCQDELAKLVITALSQLQPDPLVKDPVHEPNNLAAGLLPTVVANYAEAALVDWPTQFLRKIEW